MKAPLEFVPMALCGLATIVAVAVILVASDLLRRGVLVAIAYFEERGRRAPAVKQPPPAAATPPVREPSRNP